MTAVEAYQHEWAHSMASAMWALCCWVWLAQINSQQTTRDMGRRVESAMHDYHRSIGAGGL